ncbi:MAG: succinate dehydrogenase, hydrophobic rane anchor protein [Pseudomonadota bacterium]
MRGADAKSGLRRGSARNGVHHWLALHRVSSFALLPLSAWFACSLLALRGFDYAAVVAWLSSPWQAVLACLFVATSAWHSKMGIQVVIEDYVHGHGTKLLAMYVSQFVHVLVAMGGLFAVLKIAFGAH